MSDHQDKYGIKETQETQRFHQSRRMFCIKDNKLYVAEKNLDFSHAVWFEKEGWLTPKDDSLMDLITRGFVDKLGNIYFYVGYNFKITSNAIKDLREHLQELVDIFQLDLNGRVFGGRTKNEDGSFRSDKLLGQIGKLLQSQNLVR